MIIDIFDSYAEAKKALSAYINGAKRHPGLCGVEYRIYSYYGKYAIYKGRGYPDFPGDREHILATKVR